MTRHIHAFYHSPLLLLLTALAVQCTSSHALDWPNWRGPQHNGISAETGWRDQWPAEGPPVAWKAKVGMGFASFAVADGRVFTTGNADNTDTVFCFDARTGQQLWKHSFPADLGDKYFEGGTTGTPTVSGGRVFTLNRWGETFCFDAATGKILWSKSVQRETGARVPTWGYGGSPLIHENLVILNVGEAGLALDKETGKIVWRSSDKDAGYSTPLPFERDGKKLALIGSGQSYLAVDLRTGQETWRIRWVTEYGVNAADPILDGGRLFLSTGYGKGAGLFQLGSGEPQQIWKSKVLRTQLNPAVLAGGHLFGTDGDTDSKPPLKCIELATGVEKWSFSGVGAGGLMAADGKLIALSDKGELIIAPISTESFNPTARAQILGGKCWTAPVLANGFIYCRNSRGDIAAVDVRKK